MNTTEKALQHVTDQWERTGPQSAQVIDLRKARQDRERERFLRAHTRPMRPNGPEAA